MTAPTTTPWQRVTPFGESLPSHVQDQLATVDSLRSAWEDAIQHMSEAFEQARKRSLRRHAIETGIIERLYDVDWGVTEALVAEGITAEVAARAGGLDEDALLTIRTQLDALELLVETARHKRPLTLHFIRELHQAITSSQRTYRATDQFDRSVDLALHHGQWKTQPNHVRRPDGSVLEYTPPEHVQLETERLVALYEDASGLHPIVEAAWLHHRFICIHPFEDGNGRVGRALVLLVLLERRYAPLVVSGTQRASYLSALDNANAGDLVPLIRLFAQLEIVALRSELVQPALELEEPSPAADVARAYAERLLALRADRDGGRAVEAEKLAGSLQKRIRAFLDEQAVQFREVFVDVDPQRRVHVFAEQPGSEKAHWWRSQLVRIARELDFSANLSNGSWWTQLRLVVLSQTLRYVTAVQKVGQGETGVLALTVFAEILIADPVEADSTVNRPVPAFKSAPEDSVTLVYTDDADTRWAEVREVLERTLAAALDAFGQQLM